MKYLLSTLFVLFFALSVFTNEAKAQCTYQISPETIAINFAANGGNPINVQVTAPEGCNWTATSNNDWLGFYFVPGPGQSLTSVSGTGNGTLSVRPFFNGGDPRTGTISVADKTLTVEQNSGCQYAFFPAPGFERFAAIGGTKDYRYPLNTGLGSCGFRFTTDAPWITLNAYSYTVAPSEGVERTGTIIYHYGSDKTLTFSVYQEAGCFYSISLNSANAPASGASGSVDLITGSVCEWRAEANQEWITVNQSGKGNALISYSVTPNTGAARTGIINIGGQIFTVNQAGVKSRKRVRFF